MTSKSNKSNLFERQISTSSDEGSPEIPRKKIDDKALNEAVEVISNYLDNSN